MKKIGIILAAGSGSRLGDKTPKCLIKVKGKEIYKYSLETFVFSDLFDLIVLVLPETSDFDPEYKFPSLVVIKGGKTRNESFELAMECVENVLSKNDVVVVHDAARMFVTISDLKKVANCKQPFASLCYETNDTMYGSKTLKLLDKPNYNIQTPQMCTFGTYLKAKKNAKGTDLFSYLNLKPTKKSLIISKNKMFNLKITNPLDLEIVKLFLGNK